MTTALTTITTAPALAAHPYYDGGWAWWPIFPILWFLFIVVAFFAIARWGWWGRRRWYAERRGHATRAGQERLAERFAAGDITEQEYRSRLAVLREGDEQDDRR